MKRIVTVQDISCVGRCSLTVALPILSAMGVETSVLPTALLSSHTLFPHPAFRDLTEEIPAITSHWKEIGVGFDGIYTGYLGSLRQLALISGFIDAFRGGGFVFIDPVMGDHGRLYTGFNDAFVVRMRQFCAKGDVIVPNLTEACLLLDVPYPGERYTREQIAGLLRGLTSLGVRKAILTGVSFSPDELGAVAYDSETDSFCSRFGHRENGSFHGTGDIFASVCVGAIAGGRTLGDAVGLAVDFVCECIRRTDGDECDRAFGVHFEEALPSLIAAASLRNHE